MTDTTLTVRVSTDLKRAYEEAANGADAGVTTSDIVRDQLAAGIEDGTLEIPDEFQTLAQRSRVVDKNKINQLRGGFRARVVRQFRKRWEAGWTPDEVDLLLDGYREEARVLFEDPDEQIGYLEDLLSEYRDKWETSDYDPLDDPFGGYGGVTKGEQKDMRKSEATDDAKRLLQKYRKRTNTVQLVVDKLSKREGMNEEDARDVLREIGVEL